MFEQEPSTLAMQQTNSVSRIHNRIMWCEVKL